MFQSISFLSERRERLASSIKLLGALLFLAPLGAACSDTNPIQDVVTSPYGNEIQKLPSFFYRVTASYTLLETGEDIEFDYVAACGGSVLRSSYTSPTVFSTWHPRSMFQPTSNGEAVGVRTPNMCHPDAWGYTDFRGTVFTEEDVIPDDFLPLTVWFPDINRLSWGIGYDSDVAYESPYARIKFNGSTLTKSNADEWIAWRERAEAEYEQIGGLPGPWGWQGGGDGSTREEVAENQARNGGFQIQMNVCTGGLRVPLPESIREEVLSRQPEHKPRFWAIETGRTNESTETIRGLLGNAEGEFDGADFSDHGQHSYQLGVLKRDGGGRVKRQYSDRTVYQDRFPVLKYQPVFSERNGELIAFQEIALLDPEWTGFTFCGFNYPLLEDIDGYFSGESRKLEVGTANTVDFTPDERLKTLKEFFVRADGVIYPTGREPRRSTSGSGVIDQSGQIFSYCCAIRG